MTAKRMEKGTALFKLAQDITRLFPRGEEEVAVRLSTRWDECDWLDVDHDRNRFRGRLGIKLMGEWRKLFVRGSYRRVGFSQRNREITCLVTFAEHNDHVGIWTHATGWDFPRINLDRDAILQPEHEPEEFAKHYERMEQLLMAARILRVPVNIRTMDGISVEHPRGEIIQNARVVDRGACNPPNQEHSRSMMFWVTDADSDGATPRDVNFREVEAVTSLVDGCLLERLTPQQLECNGIALIKAWQCNQRVVINQGGTERAIVCTVVNPFAMVDGRRGAVVLGRDTEYHVPLDAIFGVGAVGDPSVSLDMLVPDRVHRDRLQAARRAMQSVPFVTRSAQLLDGRTMGNSHTGFVRVWLLDGTVIENCEVQVCSDESPEEGNQLVLGRFNSFDGHAKDLHYFKDLSTIAKVEPMHPEVDLNALPPA